MDKERRAPGQIRYGTSSMDGSLMNELIAMLDRSDEAFSTSTLSLLARQVSEPDGPRRRILSAVQPA
jgi:hypothetical protein